MMQLRADDGGSLVELALLTPVLLLLLVGSVDLGRAFYAAIEVSSAASAGAAYGVQNPADLAGIARAAAADAADLRGLRTSASSGFECEDGSAAGATPPGCQVNVVRYVQVLTTFTYTPLLGFPGVPGALTLHGQARMRAGL